MIGLAEDPDVLDPTLARTFVGRIVFLHMCEKLYDLDSKLNIVPQLAAALPQISTDKLTYTIKVRTGIKFNDGTALTAAAVKQSLERHLTFKGSTRVSEISPIGSVDVSGSSVVLHLKQPFSPLTAQLADRAGMIMSPKALADHGDTFGTNPVCVGAFMFKERVAGDHITLVKSPHYYDKAKVHAATIRFRIMTDPSSRTQSLRAGDIQVADRVQSTDVPVLQKDTAVTVIKTPTHRLPGPDAQHREQERPAEAVLERRHAARPFAVPAAGLRRRARPDGDQQGRLQRAEPARLLPDLAGQPLVRDDERAAVQPDARTRSSRRSSSRPPGSRPRSQSA